MNNNQVKGHANEVPGKVKEVASKVPDNERTDYKDKAEKNRGKGGAVLGEINGDSKKDTK